jgi:hypothetical protein
MRSFELPADRLYSISLRAGKGGESLFGHSGDGEKIQASIHGMNRHAWVALVLGLSDGKSLVLAAGKRGQHGRLRQDGMAIAAHLGLAFEDGGAEASPEPPTPPPSTPPTTSA